MLYDDIDWPEWIEELYDNDDNIVSVDDFDWEFIEDNNNSDDTEYA